MDRLISEQKVLKIIDNLKANFTCYDFVTLDEVASHVKAIPSAEPYKGMTNGQVHNMLYQMLVDLKDGADRYGAEYWWNKPFEPQKRSDKE